jgi:class 3 adenylate cyclase/TolB-like protein
MLQGPTVPTERVERRLAAILAADVAGYSRLMGADEGSTLRQLKAHKRALVDPNIAQHRGRIVKTTGDGMLVEFASVVDAVRCAVEVQRGMAERNVKVPEDRRVEFRVGINVGDIVSEAGDIFGDGVNVAARLEALAEPGGICVSGRVQEDTAGRLPVSFEDRGEQHVKNISRPVRVYALAPKTIAELPSPLHGEESNVTDQQAPRRGLALGGRGVRWSLALLVFVAVAGLGTWQATERSGKATAKHSTDETPTVAVLSFDNLTGDPGQENFSDGISEELITALNQFEPLRVLARNTTFAYKGKPADISELGRKLRAQYVIEGSFRHVGDAISVTAQLIDARTGNHVWAQTYERAVGSTSLLTIQNEVARRIGAAIGDQQTGAIARTELERSRLKAPSELSSYECLLQGYQYFTEQSASEPARRARLCLEATLGREPANAFAWSMLGRVLVTQRMWGSGLNGPEADDVEKRAYLGNRAVEAGNRAVDLAPGSALAHYALFIAYYGICQPERMRLEAERVLAIDPNNAALLGPLGNNLAYVGLWDLGVQLAEKGLALAGPSAPRWWWWAAAKNHYRKGQYEEALEYFRRSYVEQNWLDHLHLAYTLPYVGRIEEARAEIAILIRLKPTISVQEADRYYELWCFDKDFREKMTTALRRAGLREEREQVSKNE